MTSYLPIDKSRLDGKLSFCESHYCYHTKQATQEMCVENTMIISEFDNIMTRSRSTGAAHPRTIRWSFSHYKTHYITACVVCRWQWIALRASMSLRDATVFKQYLCGASSVLEWLPIHNFTRHTDTRVTYVSVPRFHTRLVSGRVCEWRLRHVYYRLYSAVDHFAARYVTTN